MVAHSSIADACLQPQAKVLCPAKLLLPPQRRDLAVQALARTQTITTLAARNQVSRKFVSRQVVTAEKALGEAFAPQEDDAKKVLFYIPVTKQWLDQVIFALTLLCHSSIRGVMEFCRDLLDYPVSVGKIHNVLHGAVAASRAYNQKQDLSGVRIGAHDEIFQSRRPVLVGADVRSSYCYLLSPESQRDGETWAVRLLELQDRGFHPEATVADEGSGLRAGQALAMPGIPCRGDVFHALQLVQPLVTFLENRAYEAIGTHAKLAHKYEKECHCQHRRHRKRTVPTEQELAKQLEAAAKAEAQAIDLARDIKTLAEWLGRDVLALAGGDYPTRCKLFNFVIEELQARQPLCPHCIGPVVSARTHQRDDLLAFAAQLDQDLAAVASQFRLPVATVREVFNNEVLEEEDPLRWSRDAGLRERLGGRFFAVSVAVAELAEQTVRASSVIENLNSRLRSYFFLRRHLGRDYLALLQFFLNHRRFVRSARPERVGKSPAELLTGQPHPHWLEMLGYTCFSRD